VPGQQVLVFMETGSKVAVLSAGLGQHEDLTVSVPGQQLMLSTDLLLPEINGYVHKITHMIVIIHKKAFDFKKDGFFSFVQQSLLSGLLPVSQQAFGLGLYA